MENGQVNIKGGRLINTSAGPAIRIGDKIVPVTGFDENGRPVIKAEAVERPNAGGGQDVVVKVPFLQIQSKSRQ